MTEINDLKAVRRLLVERRRNVAKRLAKYAGPVSSRRFVECQTTIEAIDRAIKDEARLNRETIPISKAAPVKKATGESRKTMADLARTFNG